MIKQKIAYIDELKREIRRFQRTFEGDFEVLGFLPAEDMEQLIEQILKSGAKAVIADYLLSEFREDVKYAVRYDGVQLVEAILKMRQGFPCFVLTSYAGDAIQESHDVNLVYPKDAINPDQRIGNTTFQEKVRVQIEHYLACQKKQSDEFNKLLTKREKRELTESEEARLLELDSFLENSLDQRKSISDLAKGQKGIQKLDKLIRSTDKLLGALQKQNRKIKT